MLCGAQTSMIVIRIMHHYTFIVFLRLHLAEYFPIFETVYNNLAEYLHFNSELGFPVSHFEIFTFNLESI